MSECDVDGILCQIKVLQSLNDLKTAMGNESFLNKYPELTDFPEKLATEISSQKESLKEALEKCGNVGLESETLEPEVEEERAFTVVEEPAEED